MANPKPIPWKLIVSLSVMIGVMTGLNTCISSYLRGGASVADLRSYTVAGISVELPVAPAPLEVPLPPEVRTKMIQMEVFQAHKKNFESMLSHVVYAAGVEASPEGAFNGALTNLANTGKLTRVSENRTPVTISGISGYRCSAVLSKSGEELEVQGVFLAKGATLWSVSVLYKKDDPGSRETALRITASVGVTP
jgi:hypothetical protein